MLFEVYCVYNDKSSYIKELYFVIDYIHIKLEKVWKGIINTHTKTKFSHIFWAGGVPQLL